MHIFEICRYKLTELQMKSKTKLTPNNGLRNILTQSKAKIYVPISAYNPNHSSNNHENQQNNFDSTLWELRRVNSQLKQKEEVYIDKLMKLEQGLEKQHQDFQQLQDLYNELLHSYKNKEQQISTLEQKYRESNRKKENCQSQLYAPQPYNQQAEHNKKIEEQKKSIQKLEEDIKKLQEKNIQLNKSIDKLVAENGYYRNKDRMNDSRASLSSKVFEELEEWQRQAQNEKEHKIKLDYENRFLRSRNQDLENRVSQLQQIVVQKQSNIVNLRQNNILLTRQNSENKLLRSTSRSPRKFDDQSSQRKSLSTNRIISQLYEEIKLLKSELQQQKSQQTSRQQNYIKQQQFYSFSQDDPTLQSRRSNQYASYSSNNQNPYIKIQNHYSAENNLKREGQVIESRKLFEEENDQVPHFAELNQSYESLQELPAELEIDNLILKNMKKEES